MAESAPGRRRVDQVVARPLSPHAELQLRERLLDKASGHVDARDRERAARRMHAGSTVAGRLAERGPSVGAHPEPCCRTAGHRAVRLA
jgi:hypothetical protein